MVPTSRSSTWNGLIGDLSMDDNCKTDISVQDRQHQAANITWETMNKQAAQHGVNKLQQRIYQATRDKDFKTVRRTKKLLFKSLYARYLAVLSVTTNQGRYTPGVDNIILRTPEEKWNLVESLRNTKEYQPKPVRIVYIPKKNGDKRKLGIPTIQDRAMQMLVYLTMIPEWEARMEPHSFGFRPGRSPIDAVQYIGMNFVPKKGRRIHPGWVLDADISACFDNIDHNALLEKLQFEPQITLIKGWLKAGSISKIGFSSTKKGTPQGGPISPLLANIALDGMERLFGIYNKYGNYTNPSQRRGLNKQLALYRYADDFVVLAQKREILEDYVLPKLQEFLTSIGLGLNQVKTRIVNISEGFDFLGFHFHRFHRRDGSVKQFIYQPSRKRLDLFLRNIKFWLRKSQHLPVQEIIKGLNRRIRGFCNYFKWSNAHKAFAYLNHRLFKILWNWVRHRHQRKRGAKWLRYRYWQPVGKHQWLFHFEGVALVEPSRLTTSWWKRPAVRLHTSPFDPQMSQYWENRSKRHVWVNP